MQNVMTLTLTVVEIRTKWKRNMDLNRIWNGKLNGMGKWNGMQNGSI